MNDEYYKRLDSDSGSASPVASATVSTNVSSNSIADSALGDGNASSSNICVSNISIEETGEREVQQIKKKNKKKKGKLYSPDLDVTSSGEIPHEVTPGSIDVWSDLPEEIKYDPSLAPFKNQYEKKYGIQHQTTITNVCEVQRKDSQGIPTITAGLESEASGQCEVGSDGGGANGNVDWNKQDTGQNNNRVCPSKAEIGASNLKSNAKDGGDLAIFNRKVSDHGIGQPRVSFLAANLVGEGNSHMQPSHKGGPPPSTHPHDVSAHDDTDAVTGHKKTKPWIKNLKITLLLLCWILFTVILMMKNEKVDFTRQISVPVNRSKSFLIPEMPLDDQLFVGLSGPFLPEQYGNVSFNYLQVWVELVNSEWPILPENISNINKNELKFMKKLSDVWKIPLVSQDMLDFVPDVERKNVFQLQPLNITDDQPYTILRVVLETNLDVNTPVMIRYDTSPIDVTDGIIYAAVVLLGLYILIIFEIVHRTFAAMLASTMSVAILAFLDERPSTSELISWIDVETLLLLFSMMVLVAILSETGIFDYLAVYAYKVTGGRVWPLINYLCLFTAVMSSFLDNVTTVLLMTPVTIRLCEVMELNPVPILMSMIIYSNVGGTLTPVGDPPNVIIASNAQIIKAGIDFATFTLHMAFGIALVSVQTYIHLRLYFKDINSLRHSEPQYVQELRHEISIWQRAAASLSSYSKDEDLVRETLVKKVNRLSAQLKRKLKEGAPPQQYKDNLEQLIQKYPIRNRVLLIKSAVAVLFVIVVFFLHSIPEFQRLSLGWTALLGAILLLILADREDMEAVMARVEWSTLLFFAALFVLMEALSKLGLIDWIGKQTEAVILSVSEESRLGVALLLILWVSAIASAFVDNIPLTTMMVRIATSLGNNPTLNLPIQPLVWALAFGACLGGNGTLIGASANVVCAGVAEQHGYRFSFMEYFRVGFPLMIGSVTVITFYLWICHVVLAWH